MPFNANYLRIVCLLWLSTLPPVASSSTTAGGNQTRQLALGDFDDLNQILRRAVLRLSDATFNSDGATLKLSSVRCRNLAIGDLDLWSHQTSLTSLEMNLQVTDLDMACYANYQFSAWWLFGGGGSGTVDIRSSGNDALLRGQISSTNFMEVAPEDIVVKICDPTVNIDAVQFSDGGLFGKILNIFKGLLTSFMESQAEGAICDQLRNVMENTEGLLRYVKQTLDQYKPRGDIIDPLSTEATITTDAKLVKFRDNTAKFAKWLETCLNKAFQYLREPAIDPNTGITDMQVNIMLRQNVLQHGALAIKSSDLSNDFKSVVYEGHNRITQTRVRFESVQMVGLDSISKFNPLDSIGDYTLQNQVAWDYLGFQVRATIELTPSILSDSIIESPSGTSVEEQVDIFVGLDDLNAELSVISLFDEDLLGSIQIGSILEVDNILPCLLSTILDSDITSLSVDVTDVLTPTISGFLSPGMDRIFTNSIDAGLLMYEKIMMNSAPRFFQAKIRPILSDALVKKAILDSTCTQPNWSGSASDLIDFRDLLLPPSDAQIAGATGQEPYGNAFSSFAMPYLNENVFQGELFNSGYVRPFTKSQSGTEGSLNFSNTLLQYNGTKPSIIYDSLMFSISDFRFHNIDTVAGPMSVLYPIDFNVLSNNISFGETGIQLPDNEHLTMTVRITLQVGGSNSPLEMSNIFDLDISIPSSTLAFEVSANAREASVIKFTISDLINKHCWLASLDDSLQKSLVLSNLSLDIHSFQFSSTCVSCSSPGVNHLPEIFQVLDEAGFNLMYKDKIVEMLVRLTNDYAQSFDIGNLIGSAPKHCPHHPSYDPSAGVDFTWPELPTQQSDDTETAIAIGLIAAKCAMIVAAKNQLLLANSGTNHPSIDGFHMGFLEGSRVVNWTTLDEDVGDWAAIAMEDLRDYLKGKAKAKAFDSDGAYTINFNKTDIGAGFGLKLTALKAYGLDSISKLEPLMPIAPQMLKNNVRFESIAIAFEVEVSSNSGEAKPMTISYELRDIIAEVEMALALDLHDLGEIELGSILDMNHIPSCVASCIRSMQLASIKAGFKNIGDPVIDGYFSTNETRSHIEYIQKALLDNYRTDLIEAAPLLFDSLLREILNAMLPEILERTSRKCLPPTQYASTGIIDFRDLLLSESLSSSLGGSGISQYGSLFRNIHSIMQEKILQTGASNNPLINDLLRGFTNRFSNRTGSMPFQGISLENSGRIMMGGLDAIFEVGVSDLAIENIDSVGDPFAIFRPVLDQPNILNNTVSFGVDVPVGVTGKLILSLADGADIRIRNEMSFAISLENVVLISSILLKLNENDFASFPLRDLSNIYCWLSAISSDGIGLVVHKFSIKKMSFGISCTSCSSPRFDELLLSLYNDTSKVIASFQENTNNPLDADVIQAFLDHTTSMSASKCPHRPEFGRMGQSEDLMHSAVGLLQEQSTHKPMHFTAVYSTIAAFLIISGFLFKGIVNWRNKKWMESLSHEGCVYFKLQREKEMQMIEILNETTTSLFRSECIPKRVRWGVPLVLAVNLGLLLGAHLCVISVVDIDTSLAGEQFTINDFLEFRFLESLKNAYQIGGAEMVILLLVFTIIWPYTKLFLSMVMWIVPPKRLGIVNRGRILLWIDAAAKLSVIDIFTVIAGVALLLVFIGGPDESYVTGDMLYSLKAIVVPRAGFYCMIMASRISRVSSRFFLEYHDKVIKNATRHKSMNPENDGQLLLAPTLSSDNYGEEESRQSQCKIHVGEPSELHDIQYSYDEKLGCEVSNILLIHGGYSETAETPQKEARWGTIGVYFGATTIVIVFIIGSIFAPSISFDASSVAALAIESNKTFAEIVQNYGVFLVMSGVLLKAQFVFDDKANYVGLGLLLLSGIISVGAVFILKAYQFIKQKLIERKSAPQPLPSFGHAGCGVVNYIRATKWRNMGIYLVSVALGIWQLGAISSYSIYLYCDILNRMFAFMSFIGLAEQTSAQTQCYSIQASLPENLGVIVGAFCVLLTSFLLQAYSQYKKNISESLEWIDNDDIPRLSLAWSEDKSKKLTYSYITSTHMSWDSIKDSTETPLENEMKDEPLNPDSFEDSSA
eukprot:CAMPEP_0183731896 /NCGR_PEP_ID=MMETSP0737-20130205/36773_1 /TAXON_ID=385413 /ORGANISM="Thalassiosira miniscula, Strain CCMP1093" /LENGTH=2078 /DNA_ID=CAMNT_0025964745 /DNA_START=63 /DNA_END=6299 /DNA_ORIENTATION=-